jgi:magnesium transporter
MTRGFPSDTAESKLITEFPTVMIGRTIKDIEDLLARRASTFKMMDYIYVVDNNYVLRGVISIKELFSIKARGTKVEKVMKKDLVTVHPLTHQERVVYLALSHNIKAIPVVDGEGHLLGVIPYEIILQIFNKEVHEDMIKFGGIFHKVGKDYATIESSAFSMIKHRVPWLIVGVIGGAITASIVTGFEHVLGTLLALAAFTPVLAFLSDAVGTQSETLAVRSMALDPKLSLKKYFTRELVVGVVLALVCGLLISCVALFGWGNPTLGVIVGISMFLSIIAAVFISTLLPFLFNRLDWDPAFASGPFATMISDIVTVAIYLLIASQLLGQSGLL